MRSIYLSIAALIAVLVAASCTNEGYDTGDNGLSYITSEFALLHTNADKVVNFATLDDGSELKFSNPFTTKWATKADTIYRALVYYDKTEDASTTVNARSLVQVPVLGVMSADKIKEMHTDPLDIESVWVAKNGSYINMSLLLKSGSTDSDNKQLVGLVLESELTDADGKRHVVLRMYHEQNSVPEYYTVQQYVSIDAKQLKADFVELRVNTYKGEVTKNITIDNVGK